MASRWSLVVVALAQLAGCSLYFHTPRADDDGSHDASLPPPADAVVPIPAFDVYIKASNTAAAAQFGRSLAISADGTTLAVAAADAGTLYIFVREGSTWTQQAMLHSGFNGPGSFGRDVSISANGSTVVVGQPWEPDSGTAWVFQRTGVTWELAQRLSAAVPEPNAFFGSSVAISGDGQTMAIGAYDEDSTNQPGTDQTFAGAVHIFARTANGWVETADFASSTTQPFDYFGYDVGLSHDGTTLVVGAMTANAGTGAAYVFERGTNGWQEQQRLVASNASAIDYFGVAVSISGDGATVAVGAPREDSEATLAPESGAAYIFTRGNTTWSEVAYLKATNAGGGGGTGGGSGSGGGNVAPGDELGWSVALSPSGKRLAVGAWREASDATGINGDGTDNSMPDAGAAYVFERFPSWQQSMYIKASNTQAGDSYGYSVSISEAGALAVGAPWEDSAATGIGGNQADNSASMAGAVYALTITTN